MRRVLALLAALLIFAAASPALALDKVRILVPEDDNLQFMALWVARDGGYFEAEDIAIELEVAPSPQQMVAHFEKKTTDAAVLPPPMYVSLIAEKFPFVIGANLMRNDPIDLIVRKSFSDQHNVTKDMTVKDRLERLKGMRVGVGPHPVSRLRALYKAQGLDADKDIEIVTVQGKEQNAAFRDKKVDALYTHSPFLEQALVNDGAQVTVYQTRGIVPEVAAPIIHVLAFHKSFVDEHGDVAARVFRAIGAAERSVHKSEANTVDTLAKGFPKRDRRQLETIVHLYETAMPDRPDVWIDGVKRAAEVYGEGTASPSIEGIDLAPYVGVDIARESRRTPSRRIWFAVLGIAGAGLFVGVATMIRNRVAKKSAVKEKAEEKKESK